MNNITSLINFGISCLFILSLRGLTFPHKAYNNCLVGIIGMCLSICLSLYSNSNGTIGFLAITIGAIIGIYISHKSKMTELPQTIVAFNGLGGLSAFLISYCTILENNTNILETVISSAFGIFTFSGSIIAFAKLKGFINNNLSKISNKINSIIFAILIMTLLYYSYHPNQLTFMLVTIIALILGLGITLKIGGADMPIMVALLNACSGFTAVIIGFALNSYILIITGSLIGTSGAILSYIMCKSMNRSLLKVLFFPINSYTSEKETNKHSTIKTGSPIDAAYIMSNSRKMIIVPGYGMAVAQAQHALKQLTLLLTQKYNVDVKFAIHPIAGRMPGHMNILLAEAEIPYETIYNIDDINTEFASTDVVYVIGANDITNPLAQTDKSSPIYGMPILNVEQAKTVFVVKRSMNTGYAGLDNPLFYADNTIMLFGDAQKITSEIIKNLDHQ